ncbi:MAG: tRNA epoxyqueuosine(34) reductase QueG [Planctomycetota bacterium]|jgi:epoxyqueuosine reductase
MTLAEQIKQKALEVGFDLVGITDASPIDSQQAERFADWLKVGYAGQMSYMHKNCEKRTNPARLLEGAQSVICVGLNYKPPNAETESAETDVPTGRVANYAQYEDYHSFIKKLLRKLAEFITLRAHEDVKFKICVDSAPLAERALAARAGLGFIGKNHMLISPELGPQVFLGEIITDLELQTDRPIANNCSDCKRCVDACPTSALRADGQFDANRCISHLTIEYKGEIPEDLAKKISDRLFGCDECVLACPYQWKAPVCKNKDFKFHSNRARISLSDVLNLSVEDFEARFADSTIERLGPGGLKRNAQICLANKTKQGD